MVAERIEQPDCSHGFVFDGFPRTVAQAKYLGDLLAQQGFKPPFVIHMAIGQALVLRRLTGRRTCKVGGEIYNIYDRPPKVEGILRCRRRRADQRPDDREEIVSAAAASVRETNRAAGRVLQAAGQAALGGRFAECAGRDAADRRNCMRCSLSIMLQRGQCVRNGRGAKIHRRLKSGKGTCIRRSRT